MFYVLSLFVKGMFMVLLYQDNEQQVELSKREKIVVGCFVVMLQGMIVC